MKASKKLSRICDKTMANGSKLHWATVLYRLRSLIAPIPLALGVSPDHIFGSNWLLTTLPVLGCVYLTTRWLGTNSQWCGATLIIYCHVFRHISLSTLGIMSITKQLPWMAAALFMAWVSFQWPVPAALSLVVTSRSLSLLLQKESDVSQLIASLKIVAYR